MTAELWNLRSVLKSWAISRTRRWKGSLRMRSSVDFWYLEISTLTSRNSKVVFLFSYPPSDLPQGNSTRPVAVWLLHSASGRGGLPCRLGGQLLPKEEQTISYQQILCKILHLGAFPPVDFRAVCLVRAIVYLFVVVIWNWAISNCLQKRVISNQKIINGSWYVRNSFLDGATYLDSNCQIIIATSPLPAFKLKIPFKRRLICD